MHGKLMSRKKADLVDLIEQMIVRYPDLEDIIERPALIEVINDLQALRHELQRALGFTGEWMDRAAESKVYELASLGDQYARCGDYANAIAIYCTILEECNASDYPTDDEGQYVDAINHTVALLKEALLHLDFAQHEQLRQRVLDMLVGTLIWDVEFGGIGYGCEAEDIILEIARPADIFRIREYVNLIADRERTEERFSNWSAEAYERFLMELDRIDSIDPEETLKRLQSKELHYLCASKLLDLKRYEQAASIIGRKLKEPHELRRGLDLLLSHNQAQRAIQLAEDVLGRDYDIGITEWLIGLYQQQGDQETEFRWQLKRMQTDPRINHYISLRAVSESLDNWQTIRAQVVAELEQKQEYQALTLVYLHDENWDLAWETLGKVSEPRYHHPSAVIYRLDFTVAEKSRHVRPALAIPIYIQYAHAEITARNRNHYAIAAQLLQEVRRMYQQINDGECWNQFIADLRIKFKQLPALQDELDKAGL